MVNEWRRTANATQIPTDTHTYMHNHMPLFSYDFNRTSHMSPRVRILNTTVKNWTKPVLTCSLSVTATALAFRFDNSYSFKVLRRCMRQYWWSNECVRLNRQWRHSYIYRNTVGSHTWFCYLCHFLKSPNEPNTNRKAPSLFLSLSAFVCVYCSKCFAFAYTLLNFIDAIVETVLKISFTVSSALDRLYMYMRIVARCNASVKLLKTVNAISMNMQVENNKIDGVDVYENKQEFDILHWYFDLMSFALQQTKKACHNTTDS